MEQETKVAERIEELMRRLERHEWRILDLEKRLVHNAQEDSVQENQKSSEYKEPILRKADLSSMSKIANKGKRQKTKHLSWIIVGIILSAVGFAVTHVDYVRSLGVPLL
jgi:hypothetical protein